MPTIYREFTNKPDDTIEQRMTNLYLGIISIGEELYCKGASVNEFNKDLTRLETVIAAMRKEFAELQAALRVAEAPTKEK